MPVVAANWREWIARFLPGELLGLAGGYVGYLLCHRAGLPPVAAAYGAAFGENCFYYVAVFVRDWFAAPVEHRKPRRILRNMVHDFGLAEILDSVIVRPAATYFAVALMGQAVGIAVGKIASDFVFYLLAILFWERRLTREERP